MKWCQIKVGYMGKYSAYYFDIETYTCGTRPNPLKDKILTIQFQRLDLRRGVAIGPLYILKEWESDEKEIVLKFYNLYFHKRKNPFEFIPVGFNLMFEFEFLRNKFSRYLEKSDLELLDVNNLQYTTPHVDLKHIAILLNGGNFYGARLSAFSPKTKNGNVIKPYYEAKQFDEIERYIKEETNAFISFYNRALELATASRDKFKFEDTSIVESRKDL